MAVLRRERVEFRALGSNFNDQAEFLNGGLYMCVCTCIYIYILDGSLLLSIDENSTKLGAIRRSPDEDGGPEGVKKSPSKCYMKDYCDARGKFPDILADRRRGQWDRCQNLGPL